MLRTVLGIRTKYILILLVFIWGAVATPLCENPLSNKKIDRFLSKTNLPIDFLPMLGRTSILPIQNKIRCDLIPVTLFNFLFKTKNLNTQILSFTQSSFAQNLANTLESRAPPKA